MKGAASINSVATAEDNKYYWDSFDLNEGGAEQDNTSHQAGSQSHLPQAMPLLSGNHVGTGQQVGHLAIDNYYIDVDFFFFWKLFLETSKTKFYNNRQHKNRVNISY